MDGEEFERIMFALGVKMLGGHFATLLIINYVRFFRCQQLVNCSASGVVMVFATEYFVENVKKRVMM